MNTCVPDINLHVLAIFLLFRVVSYLQLGLYSSIPNFSF